jgi:hypothetical protein
MPLIEFWSPLHPGLTVYAVSRADINLSFFVHRFEICSVNIVQARSPKCLNFPKIYLQLFPVSTKSIMWSQHFCPIFEVEEEKPDTLRRASQTSPESGSAFLGYYLLMLDRMVS